MRDTIVSPRLRMPWVPLSAAAALLLLLVPLNASAQFGKSQFRAMPKLSSGDVAIVRKLVREQLTQQPKGTTLSWNNSESSNSGTVTLVDRFPSRGRDCLRVRYVISPGVKANPNEQKNSYLLNNCRNADGSWHIDSNAMPDR